MDTSTTRRDVIRCNARTLDILMKHGRWTNADLARIARVAKGTVGNLRSGARKTCNIDTAVAIENALRPIALGRKNWLFAGSEQAGRRAAAIMSLVATARANGLDPHAWLTDTLTRLPTTLDRDIDDLLPLPKE